MGQERIAAAENDMKAACVGALFTSIVACWH